MADYIFVPSGARVTSNGSLGSPLYRAVETKAAKKTTKRTRKTASAKKAETETPKE